MNKKLYLVISILFSITFWISIALSENYYSSFTLPLKIIDIPANYTSSSKLPENITVKVKAEGWNLLFFEFRTNKFFYVSAKNDSVKFTENLLQALDINPWYNNEMNIIEVYPKTLTIELEPKFEKLVKVKPILEIEFKRGFGLASEVITEPDSILIKGPLSDIIKLVEIETNPIKLKNLERKTEVSAKLKTYRGYDTDIQNVKVLLDVQRIIENSIYDVQIQIENLPENIEVVLIPNSLNLTLRGGIEYFSKYSNRDIIATIDYNDVLSDTLGYLSPKIQIPKEFSLISVKPDIFRYIIKKY